MEAIEPSASTTQTGIFFMILLTVRLNALSAHSSRAQNERRRAGHYLPHGPAKAGHTYKRAIGSLILRTVAWSARANRLVVRSVRLQADRAQRARRTARAKPS